MVSRNRSQSSGVAHAFFVALLARLSAFSVMARKLPVGMETGIKEMKGVKNVLPGNEGGRSCLIRLQLTTQHKVRPNPEFDHGSASRLQAAYINIGQSDGTRITLASSLFIGLLPKFFAA
jgi:hypothetical protein